MALLDSTAAFAQRLTELGLGGLGDAFEKEGYKTFTDFAFSSRWTQASTDDAPFLEVVKRLGAEANSKIPAIRRLVFE